MHAVPNPEEDSPIVEFKFPASRSYFDWSIGVLATSLSCRYIPGIMETTSSTGLSSTSESESGSFPPHILPAAITTAVFLTLVFIIIGLLKVCNYARKRTFTDGLLGRIFNKSEMEPDNYTELHVCARCTSQQMSKLLDGNANGCYENTPIDPENDSLQETQEGSDMEEFIKCVTSAHGARSLRSMSLNSSYDQRENGAYQSDEYITYNPNHDGLHMTVEVEMHPKEHHHLWDNSPRLDVSSV
jgi:hypothetical protein